MSDIQFSQDLPRHPMHYFSLLCVLMVGVWGVFWFSYQPIYQIWIIVGMSAAYMTWGIIHHREHHDLHPKVVIEYILVALLAVLVFGSLLLQA